MSSLRHALVCVTGSDTISGRCKGGDEIPLAVVRVVGSERVASFTMNFDIAVPSLLSRVRRVKVPLQGPLLVALAYLLGAEAAFYIGTLSDQIFALFWPPNVVLFCALMIVPQRDWWLYIVAAFLAHVVAELGVGMPALQLLVAFATNCMVALLNAYAVRRFVGDPPWFGIFPQGLHLHRDHRRYRSRRLGARRRVRADLGRRSARRLLDLLVPLVPRQCASQSHARSGVPDLVFERREVDATEALAPAHRACGAGGGARLRLYCCRRRRQINDRQLPSRHPLFAIASGPVGRGSVWRERGKRRHSRRRHYFDLGYLARPRPVSRRRSRAQRARAATVPDWAVDTGADVRRVDRRVAIRRAHHAGARGLAGAGARPGAAADRA